MWYIYSEEMAPRHVCLLEEHPGGYFRCVFWTPAHAALFRPHPSVMLAVLRVDIKPSTPKRTNETLPSVWSPCSFCFVDSCVGGKSDLNKNSNGASQCFHQLEDRWPRLAKQTLCVIRKKEVMWWISLHCVCECEWTHLQVRPAKLSTEECRDEAAGPLTHKQLP